MEKGVLTVAEAKAVITALEILQTAQDKVDGFKGAFIGPSGLAEHARIVLAKTKEVK